MRYYKQQHRFYCGGDLHARTFYLHILDQEGKTRFEQNLPAASFRSARKALYESVSVSPRSQARTKMLNGHVDRHLLHDRQRES